jgi:hypothetical protein
MTGSAHFVKRRPLLVGASTHLLLVMFIELISARQALLDRGPHLQHNPL